MTEKRLDYDLLWNNYYQVIELDDEDTDYLRRLSPTEIIKRLNEQQDKITELEKNFDDLVNWASEIANRNVVLDEQIGELQRENKRLRKELGDCEKFRYTVFKRLNDEIKLLKPTNIEQYEQIQKLQKENEQLQAQIREKEQDEQLYADEIVKLNKEAKEVLDFKSLGGDY